MNASSKMVASVLSATVLSVALGATGALALDSAGEGRRLYLKYNCYGCHGMNGAGGMGPRLRGEAPEIGDVREKVLLGADEGMPSYARFMKSADITNLTAYLKTLGRANEPTWTHWWEKIPSK